MDPADVVMLEAENGIPLMTGREGIRRALRELGFSLEDHEFEQVYSRFRDLVGKKPDLEIPDLEAIVSGETAVFLEETYELQDVQITCGTNTLPVAAVRLQGPEGDSVWATSHGNGPIDAAFRAIDQVVEVPTELLEYSVQAMTEGVDALGKVTVRIQSEVRIGETQQPEKRVFLGRGADTDIIVASAKAYLFALNRHLAAQEASQRRRAVTREVQQALEEMSARYGTAHTSDFMGWRVLRGEDLI
jgi:2-isopropylmalate synthase